MEKRLNFKIDQETHDKVSDYATKKNISIAEASRELLKKGLGSPDMVPRKEIIPVVIRVKNEIDRFCLTQTNFDAVKEAATVLYDTVISTTDYEKSYFEDYEGKKETSWQ